MEKAVFAIDEIKEFKERIDNIVVKNLEIISIFIAIFTSIVSNYGIFAFLM